MIQLQELEVGPQGRVRGEQPLHDLLARRIRPFDPYLRRDPHTPGHYFGQ
ncbi:hypothetical protein ABZ815_28655 [Nonomuraea sp. NPDC047529]